jgi:hypothetical protein
MAFCNCHKNDCNNQRRDNLFVLRVDDASHREEYPGECAAHYENDKHSNVLADCVVAYGAVSASHVEVPFFLRNFSGYAGQLRKF